MYAATSIMPSPSNDRLSFQQHYEKFTAPLLDKMSSIFGYTLTVEDLDHVFDCLAAHMCHEFEVPTSYELYQAVRIPFSCCSFATRLRGNERCKCNRAPG